MEWYVMTPAGRQGPIDEVGLGALVEAGDLKPDTMVWSETMEDWRQASAVEQLVAAFPALKARKAPPPLPPPVPPEPPKVTKAAPSGGFGASAASSSASANNVIGQWFMKAALLLGNLSPEERVAETEVQRVRLEACGACMVVALITAVSSVVNTLVSMGQQTNAGTWIGLLISIVIIGLCYMGGKNVMKGHYGLGNVMMIIVIVFGALGLLGTLVALAVAPGAALVGLLFISASIASAVMGVLRMSQLKRVGQ